jgi:hypothetical protein
MVGVMMANQLVELCQERSRLVEQLAPDRFRPATNFIAYQRGAPLVSISMRPSPAHDVRAAVDVMTAGVGLIASWDIDELVLAAGDEVAALLLGDSAVEPTDFAGYPDGTNCVAVISSRGVYRALARPYLLGTDGRIRWSRLRVISKPSRRSLWHDVLAPQAFRQHPAFRDLPRTRARRVLHRQLNEELGSEVLLLRDGALDL